MYATCITELIHLNVVLPSAEAHILKMGGPETLFFQASNVSFSAVPPPRAYLFSPHHSPVATTGQKTSLSILPLQACHRICWDPIGLILLLVHMKPEL